MTRASRRAGGQSLATNFLRKKVGHELVTGRMGIVWVGIGGGGQEHPRKAKCLKMLCTTDG